jgi:uncharacterized protein (DUF983 family)
LAPLPRAAPLTLAALRCRCPRCGQGPLYSGLLTVRDRCPVCGLDLRAADTGDGPAVFVMFFLSVIVIGLAFWVEFAFAPPLWVHAVLWPLPTLALAVAVMRPAKALMVALQYRTRASEMGV